MPLSSARLASAPRFDKDRPDYTVCCGEWDVGRIYQTRGGPESLRWLVVLPAWPDDALWPGRNPGGGQGALSEELDARKAWVKLEEVP